ncbi:MAG: hypothetical protein V3T77_03615, partial [Planctomycetota bacterium]
MKFPFLAGVFVLLAVILGQAQNLFQNPRPVPILPGAGTELPSAESRAISYLAAEVPAWSKDNHCFSCHNNGDGARALYTAQQLSYPVPVEALTDTTEWLVQPLEWDNNRGNPGFSDKRLARIQFAASLVEAFEAGLIEKREILI